VTTIAGSLIARVSGRQEDLCTSATCLGGGRRPGHQAMSEDEAVGRHPSSLIGGITEALIEDVADDRGHLPGHGGEAIATQLVDQRLSHERMFSRFFLRTAKTS
jgi:hypothetical protein